MHETAAWAWLTNLYAVVEVCRTIDYRRWNR
jgi:hypothetical protein